MAVSKTVVKVVGVVMGGTILFVAGYLTGSNRDPEPVRQAHDPQPAAATKVTQPNPSSSAARQLPPAAPAESPDQPNAATAEELAVLRDKLRSAEYRLAQTGAQLEAAGQANGEYDRLMDIVALRTEANDGRYPAIWYLAFSNHSLQPRSELITFLGLDDGQAQNFKDICRENLQRIQDWELQHARVVKQTDTRLSYELPQMPDQLKASFVADLATVIDPEYLEFVVANAVNPVFYAGREAGLNKVVTYSIETNDKGSLRYRMGTSFVDANGRTQGSSSSSRSSSTVPDRWNHLFGVE